MYDICRHMPTHMREREGGGMEAIQSTNVFGYCGQWEIALNNEFHLNKYLKRCQQTRPHNRKHN